MFIVQLGAPTATLDHDDLVPAFVKDDFVHEIRHQRQALAILTVELIGIVGDRHDGRVKTVALVAYREPRFIRPNLDINVYVAFSIR